MSDDYYRPSVHFPEIGGDSGGDDGDGDGGPDYTQGLDDLLDYAAPFRSATSAPVATPATGGRAARGGRGRGRRGKKAATAGRGEGTSGQLVLTGCSASTAAAMATAAGEKEKKRHSYSFAETNKLVDIWMAETHDAIHGCDKDGDANWQAVTDKYNANRPPGTVERALNPLKSHWNRVQKDVKSWHSAITKANSFQASGVSDDKVEENAQTAFQMGGQASFKYFDAYKKLMANQRFATLQTARRPAKRSKTTSESGGEWGGGDGDGGEDEGSPSVSTRPIGRNAARAAAAQGGGSAQAGGSSSTSTFDFAAVQGYLSNITENLAKIAQSKETTSLARLNASDNLVLRTPTEGMTPDTLRIHLQMIADIKRRRGIE